MTPALKAARTHLTMLHHRAQDKILQSMTGGKNIMVTNDGATILKSLYVDNAAAKVLVGECCAMRRGTAQLRHQMHLALSV